MTAKEDQVKTLVLIRHGESRWNHENRFTGWIDVGLTERGVQEVLQAARILAEKGYMFDIAHTSVLKRAIKTLWIMLEEMDLMWIESHKSWRLNERHYGALQGLNKAETVERFGMEQVKLWRRSYEIRPPAVSRDDERYAGNDPRYRSLAPEAIPSTESLKDVVARVLPYWHRFIAPAIREGKRVLIVAHGNTLRALVKFLDEISDEKIVDLNIPNGIPLIYALDDDLTPVQKFYLGDHARTEPRAREVVTPISGK